MLLCRFMLLPVYKADLLLKVDGNRLDLLKQTKGTKYFDEAGTMDQLSMRNMKIERFKLKKSLQLQIQQLDKQIPSDESQDDDDDNQPIRSRILLLLQVALFEVSESISSITSEIDLISRSAHLNTPPHPTNDPRQSSKESSSLHQKEPQPKESEWRLDGGDYSSNSRKLLDRSGKPLQTFTITNNKQQIKAGTFRPGHSLPTMSVEQFIDQEFERGNVLSGGTEQPESQDIDDNDYNALDAETMKQRQWDEFTEQNPRGSGNTMNRG
ncbi:hypothetical protein AYI68_g2912 [Smittium mucronatum]|uniref:Uncharacterized protein n=1 Tax=Smittium mucronatum TaxID=133383 RepID=A0A1R0H1G6_9FUNG|nr:hypothetical protein AYI68_g2912 [Smittium mucronatum]